MAELRLRVDPSQMVAGAAQGERSLKDVADQAQRTESATERLGRGFVSAGQRIDGASRQFNAATAASRNMGTGLQNAAFQVGDFAVQVGAGTSAAVALAQQLPQLLGGFGVFGAVAGAAVAIAAPLASHFLGLGAAAGETKTATEALSDAVDDYRVASEEASASTLKLIERYGSVATAARGALEAIAGFERRDAIDAARTAIGDVTGRLDALSKAAAGSFAEVAEVMSRIETGTSDAIPAIAQVTDALIEMGRRDLAAQVADVADLARDFGLSVVEAGRLAEGLLEIERAEGAQAQAEAAERLRIYLSEAGGETDDLQRTLAALVRELGISVGVTENLGKAFDNSASSASRMADQIERAASAAAGLAASGIASLRDERLRSQYADDPVGLAGELAGAQFDDRTEALRTRGGMGGPAGSGLDQQRAQVVELAREAESLRQARLSAAEAAREAARSGASASRAAEKASRDAELAQEKQRREVEQTRSAYEGLISTLDPLKGASLRYRDALEAINEAQEAGIITAGEASRAQGLATQEFDKTLDDLREGKDAWDDYGTTAARSLTGILTGAKSVGEAISDLAGRFADMAATRGFEALLMGGSGSKGGGLFGWLGTAITAGIGGLSGGYSPATASANRAAFDVLPFANGGVVERPSIFPMAGSRRMGLMGEAGPEAIMPIGRTASGKMGVLSQGGGGGEVGVRVYYDKSAGEFRAEVESISGAVYEVREGATVQKAVSATYATAREVPIGQG